MKLSKNSTNVKLNCKIYIKFFDLNFLSFLDVFHGFFFFKCSTKVSTHEKIFFENIISISHFEPNNVSLKSQKFNFLTAIHNHSLTEYILFPGVQMKFRIFIMAVTVESNSLEK